MTDRLASRHSWLVSGVGRAVVLLAFLLLVRAITFGTLVINSDEEIFVLAAREVLNGHLPYQRLFDVKPVGSTLLLALVFKLLGLSFAVARFLGVAFVWGSAVLLAALVERGGLGRVAALFAGLIFIAYSGLMGGLSTITETLLIPFTILAVLLLHRALAPAPFRARLALVAVAGVSCGMAVLIKILPIAPGGAVALLVCALLVARRQASIAQAFVLLASFGALAVLPMVATALVYVRAGAFDEFLYANFGFARAYGAIHPPLGVQVGRLAATLDALWPLLVLAAAGVGALLLAWRRDRRVDDLGVLACVWLLGEIASSCATLQFYPYYFLTAVAPLAVLSMTGIAAAVRWIGADRHRARATAILAAGTVLIGAEHTEVAFLRDRGVHKDYSRAIAAAVGRDPHARPPTMFVTSYDLQSVYVLTGAPLPPTRYALPSHLMSLQSKVIGVDPLGEIARILASGPDYIVVDEGEHLPDWALAPLRPVLASRYRPVWQGGSVRLYRANPVQDPV